jgi:hypothetical protein
LDGFWFLKVGSFVCNCQVVSKLLQLHNFGHLNFCDLVAWSVARLVVAAKKAKTKEQSKLQTHQYTDPRTFCFAFWNPNMPSVNVLTLTGQTKTFPLATDSHVAALRQKVALWQCVTPDCVTLLWCGSRLTDTSKLTSVLFGTVVHAVIELWPATYDRLTKDIQAAKASCVCKQHSDLARLQDTVANLNF